MFKSSINGVLKTQEVRDNFAMISFLLQKYVFTLKIQTK